MNAPLMPPPDAGPAPAAFETSAQFAAIEFSGDASICKTPEGIITHWSPGAEKMFGYPAAEIIGQPMLLLIPPDRFEEERQIVACARTGYQQI